MGLLATSRLRAAVPLLPEANVRLTVSGSQVLSAANGEPSLVLVGEEEIRPATGAAITLETGPGTAGDFAVWLGVAGPEWKARSGLRCVFRCLELCDDVPVAAGDRQDETGGGHRPRRVQRQ